MQTGVFVVYNYVMPKRLILTEKQIKKIELLRLQNLSYSEISAKLNFTQHIVRKHCSHIKLTKEEIVVPIKIIRVGKYDYKFEEPRCQGKNYNEYFK